jgi:Ras family protein A
MAVANKMGARYMECSSKEMTGVDEIFRSAINTVVQNDRTVQQERQQEAGSGPNQSSGGGRGGGMRKKKRTCKFL